MKHLTTKRMQNDKRDLRSAQIITIVALVTALSLLGDSMLYVALPIYWESVELDSMWQVGIVLSINRFIRLPFNPLAGWIYHRISLKTGLMVAVILGGLSTLGYGFFKGFIAWVILRSIWGIAWSFFRIGGLSIVANLADEHQRGRLMGLYNGLHRLGSLFGLLLGGLLVPIIGIENVSFLFGILTLLGLPFIIFSLKTSNHDEKLESENTVKRKSAVQIKAGYKLVLIMTGFLITMLYQGVFTSTLSSVIHQFYGSRISIFEIVMSVTLFSGIIQAARWTWEPFLARVFGQWSDGPKGRLPLFIGSLIIASITFGLISVGLPIGIWILVTILAMICATSLTTIMDAIAIDTSQTTNIVAFLTIYSIAQDIGAALGPLISYFLVELNNGFAYLYWGGTAILLLLAIMWSAVFLVNKESSFAK